MESWQVLRSTSKLQMHPAPIPPPQKQQTPQSPGTNNNNDDIKSVDLTSTLIQPWEQPNKKRKVKKMAINKSKVVRVDVNFEKTTIAIMNTSKMEVLKDSISHLCSSQCHYKIWTYISRIYVPLPIVNVELFEKRCSLTQPILFHDLLCHITLVVLKIVKVHFRLMKELQFLTTTILFNLVV